MKLYKYKDYDDYISAQCTRSTRQWESAFYDPASIKMMVKYLVDNLESVDVGICHGVKHGNEVNAFIDEFAAFGKLVDIIGTELNPKVDCVKHCIVWDFDKIKDEWICSMDFIYSNSFDHSRNPTYTLDQWMTCVKPNGYCIIEWAECDGERYSGRHDPFGASMDEYKEMITKKYDIVDVLKQTKKGDLCKDRKSDRWFIIIKHRK